MMKKIRLFLMLLCFCGSLLAEFHVSAQSDDVYDQADLLSITEEEELQNQAEMMREFWEMNFVIVTTDDAEGKTSREYADDFYDALYPEEDGILYLLDMDNGEIYLSTSGLAIRYLTDDRIDSILDTAFSYVSDGDYYGTFEAFMNESEYYLSQGIPENQYNYDVETGEIDAYEEPMEITLGEFLFALAAALIPAFLTMGVIKAKYQLKFEDFHYDPSANSEIAWSVKSDRLVNKIVTHRRIPKNTEGNGRSGGGSRSSVHHSSGGGSHGGGGRKF